MQTMMKLPRRSPNRDKQVTISGFPFSFGRWHPGQRLRGHLVAIDTETAAINGLDVPPLAVAAASDGQRHLLIHPNDLAGFLRSHANAEFVCHNAAFDFWVIHQHLSNANEVEALQLWRQTVEDCRLHDTMLSDILIRLAGTHADNRQGDAQEYFPRDLAEVLRAYTGLEISKDDPYRLRFGEIIGADWNSVDPKFFEYAIKDPIGTGLAYREMRSLAFEIMCEHGFGSEQTDQYLIYPDAIKRFGLLSEAIQVEGAIALAQLSRDGLHTAPERLREAREKYLRELQPLIDTFRTDYPGILLFDEMGNSKLTPSGLPSKSLRELDLQLVKAVDEINQKYSTEATVPRTPTLAVAHALNDWEHLVKKHPFLQTWSDYEKKAKRWQFFDALNQPVIHPRYRVLVNTGRTSCSKPNLQQVPREDTFREIIVPSPGHWLLSVDYSYVELVTLAAVCQKRFGFSRLGDVIRSGIDPHCYTAAMLMDVPLEEFMSWKDTNKVTFKETRQQAKPVNFGVPGGMGPEALVDYAWKAYGVVMELSVAQDFHRRLTEVIYPELALYLADSSMAQLASKLNIPESICRDTFCIGDMTPSNAASVVRKTVAGQARKKDGTPYQPHFVSQVWDKLLLVNRNPDLSADLQPRVGSSRLAARLFETAAVTLTGRVRGNTGYTQQRNTPFQALASDGAKRALARLVLAGYRTVGFIHDEVLVELPDQGGYVDLSTVESVVTIMRESMQEMTGDVPVGCEYALSDRWSKSAELIVEDGKVRPWKRAEQ